MLTYYSIILVLSVWACCNQAAPTSSKEDLSLVNEVAAQTSKLILDSLFGNTKSAAEAKEQWTTYYYNRYPNQNLPSETEKAEQQMSQSEYDKLIRKAFNHFNNGARAQFLDAFRKGISNKRWPTYKYNYYPTTQAPRTTQYPNYYPGTTRSYPGWMQDLLEMDQNE